MGRPVLLVLGADGSGSRGGGRGGGGRHLGEDLLVVQQAGQVRGGLGWRGQWTVACEHDTITPYINDQ